MRVIIPIDETNSIKGHNEAIAELGRDSRLHKLSGDSFQKSPLDGDVSTNIQILAEALLSGF